jgi:hypothetical protein
VSVSVSVSDQVPGRVLGVGLVRVRASVTFSEIKLRMDWPISFMNEPISLGRGGSRGFKYRTGGLWWEVLNILYIERERAGGPT